MIDRPPNGAAERPDLRSSFHTVDGVLLGRRQRLGTPVTEVELRVRLLPAMWTRHRGRLLGCRRNRVSGRGALGAGRRRRVPGLTIDVATRLAVHRVTIDGGGSSAITVPFAEHEGVDRREDDQGGDREQHDGRHALRVRDRVDGSHVRDRVQGDRRPHDRDQPQQCPSPAPEVRVAESHDRKRQCGGDPWPQPSHHIRRYGRGVLKLLGREPRINVF